MADDKTEFWDRIEGINSGMLAFDSDARFVPMSHYADREGGRLWFITAKGTHMAEGAAAGGVAATHIISDQGKGLYADIHGKISVSNDEAKLDELWNAVASSWFEEGRQDPDIQLLEMVLSNAEVWITGGSAGFLYEIAKSKITGKKPDMGSHGVVTF